MSDPLLERWLEDVVATSGLTSLDSVSDARQVLLEDALRAAPFVDAIGGPVIDVGSGGGSPGLPLAAALPGIAFTLLEAERRKARFLERASEGLANVEVVWGRAEEHATDVYAVALAKALAKPPVAAELCLPLVRQGGAVILWLGETASRDAVAKAAAQVGGRLEGDADGLVVLRKVSPTPTGFPRRPGIARKRPLA